MSDHRPRRRSLAAVVAALLAVAMVVVMASPASGALADLEEMARRNPNDMRIQFLLGKAYSQGGEHLKAKQVFQDILERKKAPVVFLHLGFEMAAMGNLTGAILNWTSVIEKKPNNLHAMQLLANALHKQALQLQDSQDQQDLFEQSLSWWKRILRLDPGNLTARYYAGIECFKLGRHEQACKHWLLVLRVKNDHRKTLQCMAKALLKLGRLDESKRVAAKIVRVEKSLGRSVYTEWAQDLIKKIDHGEVATPAQRAPVVVLNQGETQSEPDPVYNPDKDPEPSKVPRPADAELPVLPTPDRQGNIVTIQAEKLFLDGLEFKDAGNHEKALFALLQVIDIDPTFVQAYLQIGEIYLQLAKTAPTVAQFGERLALSLQALDKAKTLAPGSLLAHAAQSKLVLIEKMKASGFKGFHISNAHSAIKDGRPDGAFDEYLLLLSNKILEPGVFLELGSIVKKISKSNKQDLQYFTEELSEKNKGQAWVEYLLGKVYEATGQNGPAEDSWRRFLEHYNPKGDPETFEIYVKFVDHPEVALVDKFLCARFLLKLDHKKEAAELIKAFLAGASKDTPFFKDAGILSDQLERERRTSSQSEADFRAELSELTSRVTPTRVLFDDNLSPSHLDDALLKAVELFLEQSPGNSLARFVRAWLLEVGAAAAGVPEEGRPELKKRAEELFHEVLGEKTGSADWHFTMGIQALHWGLKDRGLAHLKLVGDILIAQGLADSGPFADRALVEAEAFDERGKLELGAALIKQAQLYAPTSLHVLLVRAKAEYRRGSPIAALGQLVDWLGRALATTWFRRILLCDAGLVLFLATMATLLLTSAVLTAKYLEPLHHFFAEFVSQKGLVISLGLALMAAVFLFFFATGLVVFLPAALWPYLRDREKLSYLLLVGLLVLVPLLLPVSFFDNFELIKQVENLRSGDLAAAKPYFTALAQERSGDYAAQYARALIALREGDLDLARESFTKLAKQGDDEAVLVNLGVVAARKGDHAGAIASFQKALSLEAKSIPALFDISSVYAFQNQQDKADQYLRWATSLATEEHQIDRFRSVSSSAGKLILMDGSMDLSGFDSYFSFFSTENFFRLNANLILFITWFVIGGGLIGFLLFQRERMDIVLSRCSHCSTMTCNACQQVAGGRAYCGACADVREQLATAAARQGSERDEVQRRFDARKAEGRAGQLERVRLKAYLMAVLFPGSGPLFTGEPILATLGQLGFWASIQGALGGWLLPTLLSAAAPGADVLGLVRWLLWAGALFFLLLGLALLHRRREDLEWM